jgi:hypothetical protein
MPMIAAYADMKDMLVANKALTLILVQYFSNVTAQQVNLYRSQGNHATRFLSNRNSLLITHLPSPWRAYFKLLDLP